jgi:heme-degrading monooxygenase HmoA
MTQTAKTAKTAKMNTNGNTNGNTTAGARVVFLVRVPTERTQDFLDAYERIRYAVAEGVPGHIVDQVCQAPADPEQWLITSEWTSLEAFEAWEGDPAHRELVRPLGACITDRKSLRFVIRAETGPPDPATRKEKETT